MPTAKAAPAKKPNALAKLVQPDSVLALIVGSKPMPRPAVVKKLWEYIKKHGLQDAKNRRQINADAALTTVFNGAASVDMFAMTKLVSGHMK